MVPSVAVVGATGAVGEIMRQVLDEHSFPLRAIKFLASERSAGKTDRLQGQNVPGRSRSAPRRSPAWTSCCPARRPSVSREFSPMAAKAGAIVIDNSSAWRMDPDVPLVVPEVNADALRHIPKGIVANPNCSTIQMVVALKPLHDLAKIKRVVVSTYQASSGKGAKGLFELDAQVAALGRGEPVPAATAHAAQLAGNVLPHDWKARRGRLHRGRVEDGPRDAARSWATTSIQVSPTTARVPVRIGHSEAINLEFHRPDHGGAGPRGAAEGARRHPAGRSSQGRGAAAAGTARAATRCSSAAFAAIRRCRTA